LRFAMAVEQLEVYRVMARPGLTLLVQQPRRRS
jgi:hypothetical protein